MQNKPKRNFWKDKGYYAALILCIAAVGVAGYFFFDGAMTEQAMVAPVTSIPVEVEEKEPAKAQQTEVPAPVQTEEVAGEATLTTVLPVNGDVQADYAMDHLAYQPTTKDWRVHNGVDLSAQLGEAVRAPRAGTVTAVYEDEYYGTTVTIRHEDGYISQCSNLAAEVSVKAGQEVRAGEPIGTVGQTALLEAAQEPHVHFAVSLDGHPVDPATFLD